MPTYRQALFSTSAGLHGEVQLVSAVSHPSRRLSRKLGEGLGQTGDSTSTWLWPAAQVREQEEGHPTEELF